MKDSEQPEGRVLLDVSRFLLRLAPILYAASWYLVRKDIQTLQQSLCAVGYLSFFLSWLCLLIWLVRQEKPRPDEVKVEFAWKTVLIPFVLLMLSSDLGIRLV